MIDDEKLAACFSDKGMELDDDDLDQASGGISCPDQIVFFCTRCHEAKTVTKTSSALICPDCGTPFGPQLLRIPIQRRENQGTVPAMARATGVEKPYDKLFHRWDSSKEVVRFV